MKVKMRTTAAGPAGVQQAGGTYDLPDATARAFIAAGAADPAEPARVNVQRPRRQKIETATNPPAAETADAGPQGQGVQS